MSWNTYRFRVPPAFRNSVANCFCRSTKSVARSIFTRYSMTLRISPIWAIWPQADTARLAAITAVKRYFIRCLLFQPGFHLAFRLPTSIHPVALNASNQNAIIPRSGPTACAIHGASRFDRATGNLYDLRQNTRSIKLPEQAQRQLD